MNFLANGKRGPILGASETRSTQEPINSSISRRLQNTLKRQGRMQRQCLRVIRDSRDTLAPGGPKRRTPILESLWIFGNHSVIDLVAVISSLVYYYMEPIAFPSRTNASLQVDLMNVKLDVRLTEKPKNRHTD